MKRIKVAVLALSILMVSGCARGLNSIEKMEYEAFERSGVLIEEKSPIVGFALGLLPGLGSFYVRETGYGLINLLSWPESVLWDPISGYNGAKSINYDVTKHHLKTEKEKELKVLDGRLLIDEIDSKMYLLERRKIDQKYNY